MREGYMFKVLGLVALIVLAPLVLQLLWLWLVP